MFTQMRSSVSPLPRIVFLEPFRSSDGYVAVVTVRCLPAVPTNLFEVFSMRDGGLSFRSLDIDGIVIGDVISLLDGSYWISFSGRFE